MIFEINMRCAGIIGVLLILAHFSLADSNVGDGMIPFVAVMGKPTETEVRAKVAAIHAQRIGSFLIYPRSGLELEYMGEEWLRVCGWVLGDDTIASEVHSQDLSATRNVKRRDKQ